jgi:hypothetical protein
VPSVIVVEPPDRVVLPGGISVTERLLDQLEELRETGHIAPETPVTTIAAGDRAAVSQALTTSGDVVVIDGRVIAHAPALRAVIGDDRIRSGLLVGVAERTIGGCPVTTDREGKVVTAIGTPLHEPLDAPLRSSGVIRLDEASAAAVAQRLPEIGDVSGSHRLAASLIDAPVSVLAAAALDVEVRLRPVPLRRMEAHRLGRPGDGVHALRRCEAQDADRAWLDAAVKAKDGWFTTFFVSPYSRFVARWAARLGLSPNQVTVASGVVGVAAAAALAVGTLPWAIVGAVALQIAFMLDCVDGQLSRYTQRFSTFGAWLDSMLDRGKELVVYLGLAIGGVRAGEDGIWLLAVAAAALLVLRHAVDLAHEATQPDAPLQPLPLRSAPENDDTTPGTATSDPENACAPGGEANAAEREASASEPHLSLLGSLALARPVMWLLRILAFPIGERFAAVSLLAVFATRRTTFLVLLVWGVIAWGANIALKLWRARRWPERRLGWLLTTVPRLLEYGTIVAVAVALPEVRPASFALILALGLRHYDEGYRARTLGNDRTTAVTDAVLGAWYARIAVLIAGALLDVATPTTWLLAAVVAAIAMVDLVRAWLPVSPSTGSPTGSTT